MARRYAVLVLLLVSLALISPPPSHAEYFGGNVRVNDSTQGVIKNLPSMAVGPDGRVYVVWQDDRTGSGNHDIFLAVSDGRGAGFEANVRVDPTPGSIIQRTPDVAVGGGAVFVVWQDNRGGGNHIRLAKSVDGGQSFLPGVQVDAETTNATQASVVAAGGATVYVAYAEQDGDCATSSIRVARSTDGGQTFPNVVTVSDVPNGCRQDADLALGPDGSVFVAWSDGRRGTFGTPGGSVDDFDPYVDHAADGVSFGPDVLLNADGLAGVWNYQPSLAVDDLGRVHAVWADGRGLPFGVHGLLYARSTDSGQTFGPARYINDTRPIMLAPKGPNHQSASVVAMQQGNTLYVTWVDDRGTYRDASGELRRGYNVYLAKSIDGGQTFRSATVHASGGNVFLDDARGGAGARNAQWSGEAVLADNGNGVLDPGVLDGMASVDRLMTSGTASLAEDFADTRLAYADANGNGRWDWEEGIVLDLPPVVLRSTGSGFEWAAYSSWDTVNTTRTPPNPPFSWLYTNDSATVNVVPGRVLAIEGTTLPAALQPSDALQGAWLEVKYATDPGYAGTAPLQWRAGGGPNATAVVPVDTSGQMRYEVVDLLPSGVDTGADIQSFSFSFSNNGATTVRFERVVLVVQKGVKGAYDALDILAVGTGPGTGASLRAFVDEDDVMYIDENDNQVCDPGEALVRTAVDTSPSGVLTAADDVLERAGGGSWTTVLEWFPLNDDTGPEDWQLAPALALDGDEWVYVAWEDHRRLADVYFASAKTRDTSPPVVEHTPPAEVLVGTRLNLTLRASDDVLVANLSLRLKPVGASLFNPPVPVKYAGEDRYYVVVDVGSAEGTIEYFFEARDLAGNLGTSPAESPESSPHRVRVVTKLSSAFDWVIVALVVAAGAAGLLAFLWWRRRLKTEEADSRRSRTRTPSKTEAKPAQAESKQVHPPPRKA